MTGRGCVFWNSFLQWQVQQQSEVKEGCRVEGRGTLQQLVSIICGGAAECTGACVYASVCV